MIIVKGAGDLATGIIWRLYQSGFKVAATELAIPTTIRQNVAFASAILQGKICVEGVWAVKADPGNIKEILEKGYIPILPAECFEKLLYKNIKGIIDARIAKVNLDTDRTQAPIVIGVGPGFTAPVDVDAVIETNRGHFLGRAIYQGSAQPNTGIPGEIAGETIRRLITAPKEGYVVWYKQIGDIVTAGEIVGQISETPVISEISGLIRGLISTKVLVKKAMKIGDIDPRCNAEYSNYISDKALAIAGGALEAVLKISRGKKVNLDFRNA